MSERPIYITYVNEIEEGDNAVFTRELAEQWRDDIIASCNIIIDGMSNKMDSSVPVQFFICKSLVDEVLLDAIIGLKKITRSNIHSVDMPNHFKIAAYLGYWWLRHKPVSLHYPHKDGFTLEDAKIANRPYEEEDKERLEFVWKLKYINELIAAQIVLTYVFNFEKTLCGPKQCKRVLKADKNFCFSTFDEMKKVIILKLLYYFAYRPIAPKIIEHILEGYTFHPAWCLTGPLWAAESENYEEGTCK